MRGSKYERTQRFERELRETPQFVVTRAQIEAEKLFEDQERGWLTRGQVWALSILYAAGTGLLLVWVFM